MVAAAEALFTAAELTAALGCRQINPVTGGVSSVVIDSRKATAGALFVPLPGLKTDGHEHIPEAIAAGAAFCLVARSEWKKRKQEWLQAANGKAAFFPVQDPLAAMQQLAGLHLRKLPDLYRIGITGSSGKTTTKQIAGSIFSQSAATYVNEGNLNSDIGLPLTVFGLRKHHRYAVLEMGINYKGEMDILAEIVRPAAALITNIGAAHIGPLGSLRAIAAEKKKIFRHFETPGQGFVHEDEKFFSFLAEGTAGKILSYGQQTTRGFEGYRIRGLDGVTIFWEELRILFPLIGYHNLCNALGAITLAAALGMSRQAIKAGLEQVEPLFGRSQIIRGPVTIIQDCYNANPASMTAVLSFLNSVSWEGRKIAVLGSMLELGQSSRQAHQALAAYAARQQLAALFLFGEEMQAAYSWLREHGSHSYYFWSEDFDQLSAAVREYLKAGDLLLVKGSRGVALERLAGQLQHKPR